MITVNLLTNSSPKNKIGKTLTQGATFQCALKDNTSILNPVLVLQSTDDIYRYNYLQIPIFGRYYFINNIVSLANWRWEISGHVDVLETYKTQILQNNAVIRRQEKKFNLYLNDEEFKTYNMEAITTLQFPENAFDKDLKYILTVNGS